MIKREEHGSLHSKNPDVRKINWHEVYNYWKAEPFLTKIELAKRLGCARKTVNRYFKKVELNILKV
jgi:AraC-like DNA-binding protein